MLFQAALAATCHNPLLKSAAKRLNKTKRLNKNGKPHKPVIIAIARLACCRFRGHEDKIVTKETEIGHGETEVHEGVQV